VDIVCDRLKIVSIARPVVEILIETSVRIHEQARAKEIQ
jgi:hypothetical protein